jgi:hypothetical protein
MTLTNYLLPLAGLAGIGLSVAVLSVLACCRWIDDYSTVDERVCRH